MYNIVTLERFDLITVNKINTFRDKVKTITQVEPKAWIK